MSHETTHLLLETSDFIKAVQFSMKRGIEQLRKPRYSPDMATCGFQLFFKLVIIFLKTKERLLNFTETYTKEILLHIYPTSPYKYLKQICQS